MTTMRLLAAAACLAALSDAAVAQDAGDCSGFKWPVDRETTAFAAFDLPEVAAASPLPGVSTAVRLKLAPQSNARFEIAPKHTPKHDPAYGGVFPLPPNTEAGAYQITLSDDGWIDVVQNGKIAKQSGFTGSHTCKSVRKSVRFDLEAGAASIEISDAPQEMLKLEVLPAAK